MPDGDPLQSVRRVVGEPHPVAVSKKIDHLDRHCRQIISLSPFLALATTDAHGHADCSPRGDPPGFVEVLDPRTLVVPDRPGNRLVDSFANLTENPGVGLLFLVPGMSETLRVNGTGFVVDDPALLERMAVGGRAPALGLGVHVDEAFLQCGRAVKRARLWDPQSQIERRSIASIGVIMRDHMTLNAGGRTTGPEDDIGAADIDEASRIAYERLYDEP